MNSSSIDRSEVAAMVADIKLPLAIFDFFWANIKRSLNVAALILAVGPVRLLYPVMFYDSVQNRSGKLCVCIDHNQ
jgi:hypothetical protein